MIQSFVNRVSEEYQGDEPRQFRGGIIADPMGLGKTLTMIALIATDCQASEETLHTLGDDILQVERPTLIVVTPSRMFSPNRPLAEQLHADSV